VRLLAERGSPCGLNGATIEPLVPLLTFIGNIELEKTTEKRSLSKFELGEITSKKIEAPKKKRGFHL